MLKKCNKQDLISAITGIVLSGAVLALSASIERKNTNGDPGSAFMPSLIGTLLLILSIILLVQCLLKGARGAEPAAKDGEENYLAILLSFLNLVLFVALMRPIGFMLSCILFLFLQIGIMAHERPSRKELLIWAAVSIAAPVLIYLIFVKLFSMPLPRGSIF